MAKLIAPGEVVYEIFAIPKNCTVLTPKFFSNGANVSGEFSVTGPTKTNATSTTHEFYQVSYTLPGTATNRKVYQMMIDWRDPSGTLQPAMIFEVQTIVDATAANSIEIA